MNVIYPTPAPIPTLTAEDFQADTELQPGYPSGYNSYTSGTDRRRIAVTVKHSTQLKGPQGEGWRTMEVCIEVDRDGMDYSTSLDNLTLAANDCVQQIAQTLNVPTEDVGGVLRFQEARTVAVAERQPSGPRPGVGAPSSRPAAPARGGGYGGGPPRTPPNYTPEDRDALWGLYLGDEVNAPRPDLFWDNLATNYPSIKPKDLGAFQAIGIEPPAEVKPLYVSTAPDWAKQALGQ